MGCALATKFGLSHLVHYRDQIVLIYQSAVLTLMLYISLSMVVSASQALGELIIKDTWMKALLEVPHLVSLALTGSDIGQKGICLERGLSPSSWVLNGPHVDFHNGSAKLYLPS